MGLRFKYLALCYFLVACEVSERKTEMAAPYRGDFLLINGYLKADGQLTVYVQKTVPHGCSSCSDTINAEVFLYENDTLKFRLIRKDAYRFEAPIPFEPHPDNWYQIKVFAQGLDSAMSQKLHVVNNIIVDTVYISQINNKLILNYRLIDVYADNSYYVVKAFDNDTIKTKFYFNEIEYRTSHTSILKGSIYIDSMKKVLKVYKLSAEIYKYVKSIHEYDGSNSDPFEERPSLIYSNIIGGYGIFGTYAETTFYFSVIPELNDQKRGNQR